MCAGFIRVIEPIREYFSNLSIYSLDLIKNDSIMKVHMCTLRLCFFQVRSVTSYKIYSMKSCNSSLDVRKRQTKVKKHSLWLK